MQNPFFKLTALAGVIGAGAMVVLEAQRQLADPGSEDASRFAFLSQVLHQDNAPKVESETTLPPAQTETDPRADVMVSGPTVGDAAKSSKTKTDEGAAVAAGPQPDPFAFLYSDGGDSQETPPALTRAAIADPNVLPADASSDAIDVTTPHDQPASGDLSSPVQLASIDLPAQEEPSPLKKFPSELGSPVLLPPPTPPREDQSTGVTLASADDRSFLPEGSEVASAVYQAINEQFTTESSAEPAMSLLAQLDPSAASRDRTRGPAAEPATTPAPLPDQGEPLDLFGPLPTGNETDAAFAPSNLPATNPGDNTLVLPVTQPESNPLPAQDPFNSDPFTPSAIPGTAPAETTAIPEPAPTSPAPVPRNRGRDVVASEMPAQQPTAEASPPATSPLPEQPFPDLFLPQESATAETPRPTRAVEVPAFPTELAPNSDPFPPITPTAASEDVIPSRQRTDATPRTRGEPDRTVAVPPPADSPFFDPAPSPTADTTIAQPRRTAEPPFPSDPFPTNEPEPILPSNSYEAVPPPISYPSESITLPSPAAPGSSNPLPSFPTPAELGNIGPQPITPTPVPTRSQFPERSSIPVGSTPPERSSIPSNALPSSSVPSSRLPANDPFPTSGNLVGTGTFDASAPSGLQPELQIEKDAPPRAVLNQPLVYNIRVRNVGRSAAHQVIVEDSVPRGSTLKGTIPEAELDPQDRHLIWKLGTVPAGEERLIKVQIIPTEPGEIGSVATVRFVGRIASKTVITAPRIRLQIDGPVETAVGDVPVYRFRLTNTGDGDAANVVIKSTIPNLFQHPSGSDLEYDVGALHAGQTRDIDLALKAVSPGQASHVVTALVDGREQDSTSADVLVLASRLSIERTGPERRFVNRPANYATQVTNQSTQTLRNVTIVERLPQGVELAAVPEHGRYDAVRRTITWTIPQLG
ncbi:MAG: hypothetical protein KDA75_02640, partial [Planctomycetaceae bacterium]|nr:hypothetical protein [Planctomycetaceae bacterium]